MNLPVLYFSKSGNTRRLAATGHYGTACVGIPDAKAIDNGARLGRPVAELARRMAGLEHHWIPREKRVYDEYHRP